MRWNQLCYSVISAAAMLVAAHPLHPQATRPDTTSGRDTARVLGGVVITATRTERNVRDVPVSASVVGGPEVRSTPALTMDDVLQSVPGVNLPFENSVVAHPTAGSISMRGLGGIRTLMLVDGVPLNDPYSGYVQWAKIPMELVDHVEVVRGANSNLFGTYALGGVINVITRTPTTDELDVTGSYGSNTTVRGNLFGSVALTDALRLTVNGSYFNTGGYIREINSEIGPIDRPATNHAQNVLGRLDFKPDSMWRLFIRASAYELGQNQGSPLGTDGQQTTDLAAGAERRLTSGGSLRMNLFYQTDRGWTDNSDPITAVNVDEFLSNIHSTPATDIGGSFQWSKLVASAKSTFAAGVDFRSINGEDRSDNYSAPGKFSFHEVAGGLATTIGVFAQDDWFATDALEIIASARFDNWQESNGHDDKSNAAPVVFSDKSKTQLSPRLSARYRLNDHFLVRGSVYQAFNAPDLDQLYRPYTAQSFGIAPNANLGPESLVGGELGLEYTGESASLQFNLFQSTLSNPITYEAIAYSPVYIITPFNLGKARNRGFELFGDWAPARGWMLSGAYTYTDAVITENPQDSTAIGTSVPDVPRDAFVGTATYTTPGGLSTFVRGRYYTSRYTDGSNTVSLSPFFVLDASVSFPMARGFESFVQVENLLNRQYTAENFGFDARGTPRQVFVGLRAKFTK